MTEKRKREIYLNGGYIDCVSPGCSSQGTADTNYLCKTCYNEQTNHSASIFRRHGNSRFYVDNVVPNNIVDVYQTQPDGKKYDIFEVDKQEMMTVKLPPQKQQPPQVSPSYQKQAAGLSTRPCRSSGCDFYGTAEMDYFCSKCYTNLHSSVGRQ